MGKDSIKKLENNCRMMPLILSFLSFAMSIVIILDFNNIIQKQPDNFSPMIVMIISFVVLAICFLIFALLQRKISMKKLTDNQKELYLREINSDDVKLYTVRKTYVVLTPSFVIENNGGTFFSYPYIFAFENMLCILTSINYDYMTRTEYMTVSYINSDFKKMDFSYMYNVEDAKEIISFIKSKAPWIEIFQDTDSITQFKKLVSSKKGREEYIDKINCIKNSMIK